ncbi:DUF2793 domain-containing protein [Sphingomonas desiccabilis]|uniref:DUF2793 domain-containing protein n=1 Tax=Sphingomonas desiccabilis TaxID=429134 RepID=A0A4Q2IPD8_9SPHN|nr:DUF2793 domain-containing protein [Sphingomonas desiccabilis]MBB3911880.1 hypothetical protein [Sphingomonas desiccabilis]RXZ31412.1 DUF2793 domain-containing protein [Sphingomonas desiccabilis]
MIDTTVRLALPMLHAGQAQKELTHNEALLALDVLLHPEMEEVGRNQPPAAPVAGQCWIVGEAPVDAWSGQADKVAAWSEAGWRFFRACEGMLLWSRSDALPVRRLAGAWIVGEVHGVRLILEGKQVVGAQQPAIPSATGGTVVDAQARATLALVVEALRTHGLVAGNAE